MPNVSYISMFWFYDDIFLAICLITCRCTMKSLLGLHRHTLKLVNFNTVLIPTPPPSLGLVKTSFLARELQWTTHPSLLILGLILNHATMTLTVTCVTLLQLADRVAITHKQVHIVVIASNYRLYKLVSLFLSLAVAMSDTIPVRPEICTSSLR